jgi:uncharacterized repeat protein (TIGR01451 family)
MFKRFYKHSLILCLLLFTQLLMVSVGKAQDTGRAPGPVRVNDELSLVPAAVARIGTAPTPAVNNLAGVAATTAALPDIVNIATRRDAGSQLMAGLQTSAISELTIDATRLVPADMEILLLSQDPTADDPFDNLNDGTTFYTTVYVPADAVRLVTEVVETTASDIQLFVGRGLVPGADSLVCAAVYCNIPSPDKGDWWILVQNRSGTAVPADTLTLAHAVVPHSDSRCDQLLDCIEDFQACLANGGPFDECWQALLDCLLGILDAGELAELKACLLDGWDDDCFEEWETCFPDWPGLDAAQDGTDDDDDDDDDCDDDDGKWCECNGEHRYDNHHEDSQFTYHEHCDGWPFRLRNFWVEGPSVVGDMEPFDLRVYWDEPAITSGDIWYAAFDVGSAPQHPGDIGTIYVDLHRFEDDVVKQVSAETAVPGDVLTYTITIRPNVTPEEPTYTITDTIPAGMTYVPGSASATGGVVSVTGSVLTWTGPTSVPGFTYRMDTSATNPACTAPLAATDGVVDGYLDLAALGISPDPIIFGDTVWYQAAFTGGQFHLFGSPQGNMLNFTDDGFVFLTASGPGTTPQIHQPIPTASDPNNLLAVLWRDMEIVYDGTRGVTLVSLVSASLGREVGAIIEYDGVQDRTVPGSTATYSFEVVAYFDVDPARYEYIFAYNNLTDPVTLGTIGLENATGDQGVQFGYNDLVLADGMAICFDQVGDGGTAVEISYQTRVDDNAFGILTNQATHITDNPGSQEASASVDVHVGGTALFLSSSSGGVAGGVVYADEDIIRYDLVTGEWSLFLDGSDIGLKGVDIDALHLLNDGSILLSLSHHLQISNLGKVYDSDILRFVPTSLGENSSGHFEMYFDGSDYGLSRSGEDVDAIGFAGDGRLVVSTRGTFKVPRTGQSSFWCGDGADAVAHGSSPACGQLQGFAEDLIVLNKDSSSWEMYFDGSDVLERRGNLGGVWINPATGDIYLSLSKKFTIGSLSGDALDIFVCRPDSLGDDTQCTFEDQLFFDGSEAGLNGGRIDGFAIGH